MISVIVPIYNIKSYIERCIVSILGQTLTDFELLLIDDGSTDGSGEICDKYSKLDKRITVFHKENGGLSDARNLGTSHAKGEWITYIDGDDYVEPKYLEELFQLCKNHEVKISVIQGRVEKEGDKKKRKESDISIRRLTGREAAKDIIRYNKTNMICAWGKLYHKSLVPILSYPYKKVHEDEFITYKTFYAVEAAAISSKPYYNYVVRKSSITKQSYSLKRLDKLEALKEAIIFFEKKKDREFLDYAKLRYFLNLQIAWYRVKNSSSITDKRAVLKNLLDTRRSFYRKEKLVLWKRADNVEKLSILIFSISPSLYKWISSILLYVQSDETM